MKIALFSDSFLPVLNGVSIAVRSLARELRELGHEAYVFAPSFHGYKEEEPNVFRFPSVHPPIAYRFPLAVPVNPEIGRKFDSIGFDLVHTHTPFFVGRTGLKWGRHTRLPIVSTYHTLYEEYVHYVPVLPRWWLRSWLTAYLRHYYNECDAIITPSRSSLKSLEGYRVATRTSIIPTGMPNPRDLDRLAARVEVGIGEKAIALLYVGRLAPEKNLRLLLRAMRPVFDRFPHAALLMVGDGPARADLEAVAEGIGIAQQVKFVGSVTREQVDCYYAAADLFVFPSQTETQGLVIGEAQTFGLPCVAIEGGGASEALEDGVTGLIVQNDSALFASAVCRLISDDGLRAQYGSAARDRWKGNTPRDTAERVLEVYSSVMKG